MGLVLEGETKVLRRGCRARPELHAKTIVKAPDRFDGHPFGR